MTMALRRAKAAPATAMSYLSVIWCASIRMKVADDADTLGHSCTSYTGDTSWNLRDRGMIAGEVLFHEQPTLLSKLGAVIICCSTLGVTLYENRVQEPQKQTALDTELGSSSVSSERRPLIGF